MTAIVHKIEKVFVEVNTDSLEAATNVKTHMGRFLETEVFPKIELALDEFSQTGRVVRINSINLTISTPREGYFNTLNEEIVKQFFNQVKLEIVTDGPNAGDEKIDSKIDIIPFKKNREEIFLFFLANGYLPWFGTEKEIIDLLAINNWQKSLADRNFIDRLTEILKNDKATVDRFIYQLNLDALVSYLLKINPELKKSGNDVLEITQNLPPNLQQLFLKFLLVACSGFENSVIIQTARQFSDSLNNLFGNDSSSIALHDSGRQKNDEQVNRLQTLLIGFFQNSGNFITEGKKNLADILFEPIIKDKDQTQDLIEAENYFIDESNGEEEKKQETFFENKENELAVQNAGLVLLHPFLKSFFKKNDFLNEKGQIKISEQQRAVQTLHFIATGNKEFFEGNLVIEKFICGIPLKMPIQRENLLSEKIKAESLHLLQEVIRQWPALKKTSPDGLRQMYIQRNGKLFQKENNFKLIVEQKIQDVLLERINWNISVVKIPWRKELLFVEWC